MIDTLVLVFVCIAIVIGFAGLAQYWIARGDE